MVTFLSSINSSQHSIDFGKNKGGEDWYVVTDNVMGGVSSSSILFTENSLLFTGNVSLDNNGGFASIRSARKKIDLSHYKTVSVKFKSSNTDRIFALRLNTNDVYYKPSYNQKFQSTSNDWQELTFKLADFKETVLGKETGREIATSELERIIRIGVMLNDKKEGSFSIEIDSILFR